MSKVVRVKEKVLPAVIVTGAVMSDVQTAPSISPGTTYTVKGDSWISMPNSLIVIVYSPASMGMY